MMKYKKYVYSQEYGRGCLETVPLLMFANIFVEPIDYYHITKNDVLMYYKQKLFEKSDNYEDFKDSHIRRLAYLYAKNDDFPIFCFYNKHNNWISLLDGNHRLALAKLFSVPSLLVYWF